MFRGFRDFMFRGSVIDLAVAVVMGAAFGAVVASLVADLLTPLIAAIFGKPDFSNLFFTVNNSKFLYGSFINAVVAFVLIGLAVYLFVVVPMGRPGLLKKPVAPPLKKCPECLSDIPAEARRCAHCTSILTT